jgi:heat shock protein HtpX
MFKAYGLYSHIRANRMRSAMLLAGFVVLLLTLMFSFALMFEAMDAPRRATFAQIVGRAVVDLEKGWPIGVGAAGAWFAVAWLFHQRMIDYATGAQAVTRIEQPRLYNLLENLCISRGVPIPALQILDEDALNAYASGIREGEYRIAVTRGLLTELTDAEIEAVLAHELTHIRNRDVQLMVVATIFAGIFAFIGDLMFRNWDFPFGFAPRRQSDREDRGSGSGAFLAILVAVLIIALSWGASVLIRFALSRSREYLADAGSVELTKNPDAMISALRKIEAHSVIPDMPSRMNAFFIESPSRALESGLYATHPSVEDRIRALVEFAGGIDAAATFTAPADEAATQDAPPAPDPEAPPRGPWG